MILPLAAAMLAFFQGEVARQSVVVGIPTPKVVVSEWRAEDRPWAWVGDCAPGFHCDDTIYVREDVLDLLGYDTMRVLALHEVLHIKYGDHIGPKTEAQMKVCHKRIWAQLERRLPADVKHAARTEAKWWRQTWASR